MNIVELKANNFKGNTKTFEMSRYIDLELYHAVERSHPYYIEMVEYLIAKIQSYHQQHKEPLNLLELGAGTGLFTQDLVTQNYLTIDALEIDSDCLDILRKQVSNKANPIHGDARKFCNDEQYHLLVSAFAHDHISEIDAPQFVRNIRRNLKKGGLYLMGGEILPPYQIEEERIEALHLYHGFIVEKANRAGDYTLAQIEINALKSGIERIGDFKRHELQFEKEMLNGSFKLKSKTKMGPLNRTDVGGVFVYIFEAI
jgi:ubiquinone/menaquinone biosynthesis C-methylase UbiE